MRMPTQIDLVLKAKELFNKKGAPKPQKQQQPITQRPIFKILYADVGQPLPAEAIRKLIDPFSTKTWTKKSAIIVTTKIIIRKLIAPEKINRNQYILLEHFRKILTNKDQLEWLDLTKATILQKDITKEQTLTIINQLTTVLVTADTRPSNAGSILETTRTILWEAVYNAPTPFIKSAFILAISHMYMYIPVPERRKLDALIKEQLKTRGVLTRKQREDLTKLDDLIDHIKRKRQY